MSALHFYLASGSPRRLELLQRLGFRPAVLPSGFEERPADGESAADQVARFASGKGRTVLESLPSCAPPSVVLAADTAVVVDESVLGKPADRAEALAMLRRLRGRAHQVLTGVWLGRSDRPLQHAVTTVTRVVFRDVPDAWLERYVAGGEPMDKAGAYGIQGEAGLFVARVEGSWTNVVGLPIEGLPDWLGRIGVDPLDLPRHDGGRQGDQAPVSFS